MQSECDDEDDDGEEGGDHAESGIVDQLQVIGSIAENDGAVSNEMHAPDSDEPEADSARDSLSPVDAVSVVFE